MAIFVLATVPHLPVTTDDVDLIELNHCYNDNGEKVFDQVIFWEWHKPSCSHRIIAWRFAEGLHLIRHTRRGYQALWFTGGRLRRVRAPCYRETWTQYDPEVHDRKQHAVARRRGLLQTR